MYIYTGCILVVEIAYLKQAYRPNAYNYVHRITIVESGSQTDIVF